MEWRNIQKHKEEVLSLLKENDSMIVFDTETAGLKSDAKIIQFSAIRYLITDNGLKEDGMLDVYLNPGEHLPEKIVEVTGITDAMLASAPSENELSNVIFDFMDTADLWAAYNKVFDLKKLSAMAERTGREFYFESDSIDILEMARDLIPKSEIENHKLGTVTQYLFPDDHTRFHSAIEDVRATAKVFEKLWSVYAGYVEESERRQVHFEYCSLWVNPNRKSMQRIRMKLNVGEFGDIFYDAVGKSWGCKSNSKAKKLFSEIDLSNLENQVLFRYHLPDMDALVTYLKNKKKSAS